jgi:hypothetical protein
MLVLAMTKEAVDNTDNDAIGGATSLGCPGPWQSRLDSSRRVPHFCEERPPGSGEGTGLIQPVKN